MKKTDKKDNRITSGPNKRAKTNRGGQRPPEVRWTIQKYTRKCYMQEQRDHRKEPTSLQNGQRVEKMHQFRRARHLPFPRREAPEKTREYRPGRLSH